jgi:hypothetical protein
MTARSSSRIAMVLGRLLFLGVALASCSADGPRTGRGGCAAIGVSAGDVASSMGWTMAASHAVPGDSQSCEFDSGARHVQVSVRPELGRVTVENWIAGRMPLHGSAIAGAGEAAVWQPDLHELIAEQHDVLCDVSMSGGAIDTTQAASIDLARRLANLCNKVFALAPRATARAAHSLWRSK